MGHGWMRPIHEAPGEDGVVLGRLTDKRWPSDLFSIDFWTFGRSQGVLYSV